MLQIENLFGRDENDDGLCQTADDVRRNIGQMPQELEGIYAQCLTRQTGPEARYTAQILRWVCASPEPAHIDNMRELLAFDVETKVLEISTIPSRASVLRAATNLVVLEPSDQSTGAGSMSTHYLLPIHSTIRDFVFSVAGQSALTVAIAGNKHWSKAETVLEIGGICAAYLLAFSGRELITSGKTHVPSAPILSNVYETSLSSGTARMIKSATGWWFKAPDKHITATSRPREASKGVEVRLLDFARRNWYQCLKHAMNDVEYKDFKTLVFDHVDASHRPWAQGRKTSRRSQAQTLFFWALLNDHAPLMSLAMREVGVGRLFHTDFWTEPQSACAGVPVLHFAVKRCNEATVSLLLPVCSGRSAYSRCTALHCAVESAELNVVKLLLDYVEGEVWPYRSLLSKDSNGRTPLHLAVIRDMVDVCRIVCSLYKLMPTRSTTYKDGLHLLDEGKCSPLYYAIVMENREIIDALLDDGVVVNYDHDTGGTLAKVKEIASEATYVHVIRGLTERHEALGLAPSEFRSSRHFQEV